MINIFEVNETNKMIEQENLDVRTITMGISLLDCIDPDLDALNQKIYEKITTKARNLVATGDEIAKEYNISVLAKLPIDPKVAEHVDNGTIEYLERDWFDLAAEKAMEL